MSLTFSFSSEACKVRTGRCGKNESLERNCQNIFQQIFTEPDVIDNVKKSCNIQVGNYFKPARASRLMAQAQETQRASSKSRKMNLSLNFYPHCLDANIA